MQGYCSLHPSRAQHPSPLVFGMEHDGIIDAYFSLTGPREIRGPIIETHWIFWVRLNKGPDNWDQKQGTPRNPAKPKNLVRCSYFGAISTECCCVSSNFCPFFGFGPWASTLSEIVPGRQCTGLARCSRGAAEPVLRSQDWPAGPALPDFLMPIARGVGANAAQWRPPQSAISFLHRSCIFGWIFIHTKSATFTFVVTKIICSPLLHWNVQFSPPFKVFVSNKMYNFCT